MCTRLRYILDVICTVDTSACTCGDDNSGLLQLSSLRFSGQLFQRLQSVFSAAARLVFSAKKSEHITTLAESSGDNSVPVMCSRLSLPYRQGAVIHC